MQCYVNIEKKTQFQHNADGIPEDSLPVNKHDSKERCPAIKEKELTLLCRETSEYFLPRRFSISNECNYLNCDRAQAHGLRKEICIGPGVTRFNIVAARFHLRDFERRLRRRERDV